MSDNFFYNDIFDIEHRSPDGSLETFTVSGMARMKSILNTSNGNIPVNEVLFLFTSEYSIHPGDTVVFNGMCCKIGKVEPVYDLNGKLQAYRVNSI